MHDWEKLRPRRDVIRFEARAELDWHKSLPRANPYGITMGRGEGGGRDDNEIRTVLSLCSVDEDEVDQKNPPTLLGQRFLSIVKKKKGGGRKEKGRRKKKKGKEEKNEIGWNVDRYTRTVAINDWRIRRVSLVSLEGLIEIGKERV